MEIHLENVRTFAGSHSFDLRPITLLVGENSSGKSTFLGIASALLSSPGFPFEPDFNDPPYALGAYDTIATFKGGRFGRAQHFGMGFSSTEEVRGRPRRVYAEYGNEQGRPVLLAFDLSHGEGELKLRITSRDHRKQVVQMAMTVDDRKIERELSVPRVTGDMNLVSLDGMIWEALREEREREKGHDEQSFRFMQLIQLARPFRGARAMSLAPIRTRPERTYTKAQSGFDPSGDHVPYLLDRMLADGSGRAEARRLLESLSEFGRDSGLFEEIDVKKLGRKATDPFQVMVKVAGAGKARNLIDVGYGVSQALPIVVQAVLESRHDTLLLQQPEVHLHPRAQAALGSFLYRLVRKTRRSVVVETHSDYVIDRIRQHIASGDLSPESVGLIFLDRQGYESAVHHITFDTNANVQNAPPGYRSFFLEEELRLFARGAE